jgi:cytochrome c551
MKSPVLPVCALLVGIVIFVYGCGTAKENIVEQDQQGQYAKAVQLYQQSCQSCHGANLEGATGPNLQHVGSQLSEADIEHRIATGGGAMPAFRSLHILTDDQIRQLAQWLATKK